MKSARESAQVFIEWEKELLYMVLRQLRFDTNHPKFGPAYHHALRRLHELEML